MKQYFEIPEQIVSYILYKEYLNNLELDTDTYTSRTYEELVDKVVVRNINLLDVKEMYHSITNQTITLAWLDILVRMVVRDYLWETPYTQVDVRQYSIMEWFVPYKQTIDEILNQ